ncbi:MAG: hypothetical protein JWN02_2598, partial [Acidobacteria bacterium]|nr:hypothetical protein [Acidobacteriota bacterium]
VSAEQAKGLVHEPAGGNGATVKPPPQGE